MNGRYDMPVYWNGGEWCVYMIRTCHGCVVVGGQQPGSNVDCLSVDWNSSPLHRATEVLHEAAQSIFERAVRLLLNWTVATTTVAHSHSTVVYIARVMIQPFQTVAEGIFILTYTTISGSECHQYKTVIPISCRSQWQRLLGPLSAWVQLVHHHHHHHHHKHF